MIHELLHDTCQDSSLITMAPTSQHILTIEDVVNVFWSANVCDNYENAYNVALAVTNEVGFSLVSGKGRFFARSKEIIKQKLLDYVSSSYLRDMSDADWARVFNTLRTMFGDVTGSSAVLPNWRTYWLCTSHEAMILGPRFSLHRSSCYWSSYRKSFKQIHGAKGYMMRGLWGDKEASVSDQHLQRIGNATVRVPIIKNYIQDETPTGNAVRVWVVPLREDTIAVFNGYKTVVSNKPRIVGSLGAFDFSPATRDNWSSVNGEICRLVATDLAAHFTNRGAENIVVRHVGKKNKPEDSQAPEGFINQEAFFIVGQSTGEFMSGGYLRGLNIPDNADMITKWWSKCQDSYEYDDTILDVREGSNDDDEEGNDLDDDGDYDFDVDTRTNSILRLQRDEDLSPEEEEQVPHNIIEFYEMRDWLSDYRDDQNPDYNTMRNYNTDLLIANGDVTTSEVMAFYRRRELMIDQDALYEFAHILDNILEHRVVELEQGESNV